jgi:hypothetical protein
MKIAFKKLGGVIGVALLIAAAGADAQSPSGGRGRSRGSDLPRPNAEKSAPRANPASDAIAAIQSELPSLRVDLKLSAEQTPAWNAFSTSVRQVRDISLASAKRLMAARALAESPKSESATAEPPSALLFITTLVDEERQRSTAMSEMQIALKALMEILSADQRRMFDRRIALAQREPLGNS